MENTAAGGGSLELLIILGVFILFMFLMSIPQSKAAKKRQAMLDAIKAGDEVETVGRIFGTVDSIVDDCIILKIGYSDSTKIKIHREGIARVIEKEVKSDKKAENDDKSEKA